MQNPLALLGILAVYILFFNRQVAKKRHGTPRKMHRQRILYGHLCFVKCVLAAIFSSAMWTVTPPCIQVLHIVPPSGA